MAAVHERVLAEDVLDRPAQGLAAVDDEQDRLLGIKAAVDEVGQQRPREGGVLSAALPEPERDLVALGRDPERDDVGAIGDLASSIITAKRTSSRRRDMRSPSAVRVRSMNISDTDVFDVAEDACSTSSPTRANLRV